MFIGYIATTPPPGGSPFLVVSGIFGVWEISGRFFVLALDVLCRHVGKKIVKKDNTFRDDSVKFMP